MSENLTIRGRLMNRIFAIPTVAQWWARRRARGASNFVDSSTGIPFVRPGKPLSQMKGALITTAGIHLLNQRPFDMVNPDGDPTWREIPGDVEQTQITITHKYYDHTDADRDLNVVFPLEHFRSLVQQGVMGSLAARHFGFMGHIDGALVSELNNRTAPEVAAKLRAEGVDFAFLTPA